MGFIKKLIDLVFQLMGLAIIVAIGWVIFSSGDESSPETTSKKPVFSQPVQPIPHTGDHTASFSHGVAPLKIRTSSNGNYHYFVKIVHAYTNNELGSYFIRSGDTLDIKVPTGSYEIKYATGKVWYGPKYLFGPDTHYSKADSIFNFTHNGYQYSGYSVELIMQQHGNLSTSSLNAEQW